MSSWCHGVGSNLGGSPTGAGGTRVDALEGFVCMLEVGEVPLQAGPTQMPSDWKLFPLVLDSRLFNHYVKCFPSKIAATQATSGRRDKR